MPVNAQVSPPREIFETAERGQIGRGEGSVEHVEVFRTVSVGTSILEDLDAYPPNAARPAYTLICEEPLCLGISLVLREYVMLNVTCPSAVRSA